MRKIHGIFVCVLTLSLAASSLHAQVGRTSPDAGFDKPLKKTVVDFGPSPYYTASRHVRNKLTCYYYPTFTVKEYDQGQKGAGLSIVPSAQTACIRGNEKQEKVYSVEWSGYFKGVKGTVVFFDAADGDDGGMPFAAYDSGTGRKLFEDSSLPAFYYQKKLHLKNIFDITSEVDENLRLAYFRVARAGCNLKTEQWDCWNKVQAQFGITQTDMPVCSGYEKADWESAIVYPVSVVLNDSPQINAVDGPVFCWPTD